MDLQGLTAATFVPLRGSAFKMAGPDYDGIELRLASIDQLPAQPHAPRREPFSLVFVGPREPRLDQRTYRLEHAALGALEIFLVPVAYADDGSLLYEAVFN